MKKNDKSDKSDQTSEKEVNERQKEEWASISFHAHQPLPPFSAHLGLTLRLVFERERDISSTIIHFFPLPCSIL